MARDIDGKDIAEAFEDSLAPSIKALHKEYDKWTGKVSFSDIFTKQKSIIIENRGEHSLNRDILNKSKAEGISSYAAAMNIAKERIQNNK